MAERQSDTLPRRRRRLLVGAGVVLSMALALVVVDVQQKETLLVERVAEHLRLLASALATDAALRLAAGDPARLQEMLRDARRLENEGALLVLFRLPGETGFRSADDRVVASPPLDVAIAAHGTWTRLERDEAAQVGLPRRAAVAGLATVEQPGRAPIVLAVLTSIGRERDLVRYERWRAMIVVGFVFAFASGSAWLALRQLQRETELAAEVERARLERERDDHLARADRMATTAALSLGIAHELATPLGVISARVDQLAAATQGNEQLAKATRIIDEQIVRMRAVIQGFLALARGDSIVRSEVTSSALVTDAVELVSHRFTAAGVALAVDAPATATLRCDAVLIVQALVNLLINGCQASKRGDTVTLRVGVGNGRVLITVEDRGPGMTPEAMERATAPFFTTRQREGGTGLGLAIAAEIAQHHNGVLRLSNLPAGGLCATIELPTSEEKSS